MNKKSFGLQLGLSLWSVVLVLLVVFWFINVETYKRDVFGENILMMSSRISDTVEGLPIMYEDTSELAGAILKAEYDGMSSVPLEEAAGAVFDIHQEEPIYHYELDNGGRLEESFDRHWNREFETHSGVKPVTHWLSEEQLYKTAHLLATTGATFSLYENSFSTTSPYFSLLLPYWPDDDKAIVIVAGADNALGKITRHSASLAINLVSVFLVFTAVLVTLVHIQTRRFRSVLLQLISSDTSGRQEADAMRIQYPGELSDLVERINITNQTNYEHIKHLKLLLKDIHHEVGAPIGIVRHEIALSENETLRHTVDAQLDWMSDVLNGYMAIADVANQLTLSEMVNVTEICEVARSRVLDYCKIMERSCDISINVPTNINYPIRREAMLLLLTELGRNAVKYGELSVTYFAETRGPKNKSDRSALPDSLVLRVENDGSAIPEENYGVLVEAGRRLRDDSPGTGWGLFMIQRLVEYLSGSLEIGRSALGGEAGGVRIEVTLPYHTGNVDTHT
ncbi:HAMP domain-containing histidine kinase [Pseudohalioglobus sediminis]|uniref:histidine kinase n=1 Tax=Pseudohalioglobus sediminis TaxID=2606449 RepID=A0A5B0WV72_9GAMM|nr:HAMP domain-containing sensor histidine kinase [Pseudohalioglobus sediminis]KAA1190091.1 HAMP domain-containing histidine kinase [Pseudohalioglobus sediminis]